jgi:hypothetical protein
MMNRKYYANGYILLIAVSFHVSFCFSKNVNFTKIAVFADTNLTFKFIDFHNVTLVECGWDFLSDTNSTVNLARIFPQNRSIEYDSSHQFQVTFKSQSNESASFTKYTMKFMNIKPGFKLNRIIFYEMNHNSKVNIRTFEIDIVDKEMHCSLEKPKLSDRRNIQHEPVTIVRVDKQKSPVAYFSIKLWNSDSFFDNSYVKELTENRNLVKHMQFMHSRPLLLPLNSSNDFSKMLISEINFTYPSNENWLAWAHNNHEIKFKFDEKYFQTQSFHHDSILVYSSNPHQHKEIMCKFIYHVEFEPLITNESLSEQIFHENVPAFIKCPIRAYNHFFPPKYYIIWSVMKNNEWMFRTRREFLSMDEFYILDSPSYEKHNNLMFKCELVEIKPSHYHPGYSQMNLSDKMSEHHKNIILNATIRLKIIKDNNHEYCYNRKEYFLFAFLMVLLFLLFFMIGLTINFAKRRNKCLAANKYLKVFRQAGHISLNRKVKFQNY